MAGAVFYPSLARVWRNCNKFAEPNNFYVSVCTAIAGLSFNDNLLFYFRLHKKLTATADVVVA